MKRLLFLPLIFITSIAYAELPTPLGGTPVGVALKRDINSLGQWNRITWVGGGVTTEADIGGAASFTTITGSATVGQLPAGSVTTVTFGATSTVNVANVNTPQMFRIVLTGTTTIVFDSVGTGTMFTLMLVQDATGTRTAQWGTTTTYFSGGTKPTLTATPLATDMLEFKGYNNVALNTGFSPDVK